jgi:hypothetical protein
LPAHDVPPLVLGLALVGVEVVVVVVVVVVVPVVVVEVVSVLPGVVDAVCGACGTNALTVSVVWTCGNPLGPAANETLLTSNRRPTALRCPFSTRTRFRRRWRNVRRL